MDAPLALAFAAGLVASVNPCGFAMLPAYLSFLMGAGGDSSEAASRPAAVVRALRVGLTVSAGFLMVFGAAGAALTAGAQWLTSAIPWAALVVGGGLAVVGALLLAGRSLSVRLPSPSRAVEGQSAGATVVFGVSYAVASLSCTLPVFLVVVGGAATRGTLVGGVITFAVYAAGMALPLLGVAVALALGRDAVVRRMRRAGRHVTRVSGALLMLAGAYIVFYWMTVLTPLPGQRPALFTEVEVLSSRITTTIGDAPWLWGGGLAAFVAAGVWSAVADRRRRAGAGSAAPDGSSDEPAAVPRERISG